MANEETTNQGGAFSWRQQYANFAKKQEEANNWMRENRKPLCNGCMKAEWDFRQTDEGKKRFGSDISLDDFKNQKYTFLWRKEHMERSKGNRLKDLKSVEYTWKCDKNHKTTIVFSEEEDLKFGEMKPKKI